MRGSRLLLLSMFVVAGTLALRKPCSAQRRPYIGVIGGVSTLSADARTDLDSNSATTSSYKPENGPTAGVFVGLHWSNYFSIQGDYLWNRNLVTLDSLAASLSFISFCVRRSTRFTCWQPLCRPPSNSRAALQLENLALRHQVGVLQRSVKRPKLAPPDRLLWVWLCAVWSGWRSALLIVKPNTVIAWHRRSFRLFWTW